MSAEWQLGIESSTDRASVALARDGTVVAESSVAAERNPSAVLMQPLRELMAGMPRGERLGVVVIGTGPASYNGSRVGIAAGQGLALVSGCPAVGLCSMEAVAVVRTGEPCLAIGDARREAYFVLRLEGGRLSGKVELMEHENFARRLEDAGERLISFEEIERLKLRAEVRARVEVVRPEARLLLASWNAKTPAERGAMSAIPPEPFYLREPYVTTAKKR